MLINIILGLILLTSWMFSNVTYSAPATNDAVRIDKIIAFGDSLSDTGNLYAYTTTFHNVDPSMPVLPDKPYYHGRFCNGLLWDEYLAKNLGLDPKNVNELMPFAFGGAWVEDTIYSGHKFPPDLKDQVSMYLKKSANDPHAYQHLYSVWSGANDYIQGRKDIEASTSHVVNIVKAQMVRLIKEGHAKNFIVINMPDLGAIPLAIVQGPSVQVSQTKISKRHNDKLLVAVSEIREEFPDVKVVVVNVFKALRELVTKKTYRGRKFSRIHFPCYRGSAGLARVKDHKTESIDDNVDGFSETVCDNPDEYVFWDFIHPSAKLNDMIAEEALEKLHEQGIYGIKEAA